jgi:large subunit ribosomal protein L16
MSQRVFVPRRYQRKKVQKQLNRFRGLASCNYIKDYKLQGETFLLKTIKSNRILPEQLECARRVLRRSLKKEGRLKTNVVCDLPVTFKSSGIRMGKGKGNVDKWVFNGTKGRILFFLEGNNYFQTFTSLNKVVKKFNKATQGFLTKRYSSRLFTNLYE